MVFVKCRKCRYEMEWTGRDFAFFQNWMADYIAKNAERMTCLHE